MAKLLSKTHSSNRYSHKRDGGHQRTNLITPMETIQLEGNFLKTKISIFLIAILLLSVAFAVLPNSQTTNAQTSSGLWREDFNYTNVAQMQAAGWTLDTNPSGVSVDGSGVILNGKTGDASIHYQNHFPDGIYDWKVECKSMWLGEGHSGSGIFVITKKHSYGFGADGYYDEFAFYFDSRKVLQFGSYQESVGAWMTFALVKKGNTISMYFNGELKNTYVEPETQTFALVGVGIVSPWRGDAKYDYYMVEGSNDLDVTGVTVIQVEKDPKVIVEGKESRVAG